jgi:predicted Holliday junction resolvase-like endonuclease
MTSESLIIIALVAVIVIAVCLCAILAYFYFAQKGQISRMIQEAQILWRAKESDILRSEQRELAHKEALIQLESWRQQELELARKQQLEVAHNEAQVQLERWKFEYTQEIRQDAIQKSQAVIAGKVTEHFVPYLPEFKYNPKDARFLGTPIDFVIFDGLDEGQVKGVVFAEIKTGSSSLNTRERQVRDAVQSGKVSWVEIRPQLNLSSEKLIESDEKEIIEVPAVEEMNDLQTVEKKDTSERLQTILKKFGTK